MTRGCSSAAPRPTTPASYRLRDDLALVQTVDFFTPIVDDPYDFGRIAAANALSDVYAMGGEPLSALNLVAFPLERLGPDVLARDPPRRRRRRRAAAGAMLVGGHSIDDPSRSTVSRSPARSTPRRCSPTPAGAPATRSC